MSVVQIRLKIDSRTRRGNSETAPLSHQPNCCDVRLMQLDENVGAANKKYDA